MTSPRLLDDEEIDRQLLDLPGVHRDAIGALVVALRAPTSGEAVRLVGLVAQDAERMGHHPDVDLRWTTVVLTLSTHSAGGVTQLDVELAHQVLEAGRLVGCEVLPRPQRLTIGLDVVSPEGVQAFWAAALAARPAVDAEGDVVLAAADGRGPTLWFQRMTEHRPIVRRFHLDVYVPSMQEGRRRLEACLAAGGRLVTDEFAPSWWVVADPEGNEVCLCTDLLAP